MHVNEQNCEFDCLDKNVQLNIMNSKGEIYVVSLSENTTVETLKNKILSYFRKTSQWDLIISFRLISTLQKRSLQDNRTLKEEQITNNDYLIMKKKKQNSNFHVNCDKRYSTITKQQIVEATKSLPSRNVEDRFCVQSSQSNFCKEIRKILVTLVDYSERLLKDHPKVKKIFNLSNEFGSDENLNFLKDDEIDEDALQKLTETLAEMGFSDVEQSKQALKLNNMNTINAIDWLLTKDSDTTNRKSRTNELDGIKLNEISNKNEIKTMTFNRAFYDKNEIYENVPKLVESFRKFKRCTFYYNKKSFVDMMKMGFSNRDVIDSLWIMNNNENLACEWLLSNRRPKLDEEMSVGLMRGSPLYKSLLKNSIIQLGLLKPKVLFAFLHLLSSNFFNGEPNTSRWLNEPDIQPIISQIFRIYQTTEKQSINTSIHQPNTNQSTTFIGHQSNLPRNNCMTNVRNYSLNENHYNMDYSAHLIPNILNNINLSSADNSTDLERQGDNWNNQATLV